MTKLSENKIRKHLEPSYADFPIKIFDVTDSTNTVAREIAEADAPEGTVVIAHCQTKGRGRRGRDFYSPDGTGLYMSMILRPENCPMEKAASITTMAAVAVCEAIEKVCSKKAGIKWVNDIFVDEKKVCGILTEAAFTKDGFLEYGILGIGINIVAPEEGFPEDLKDIAGAVFSDPVDIEKGRIAAEIINTFMKYYNGSDYLDKYRSRCFVIGKDIRILSPDGEKKATALDINDECHLLVRYEDGSIDTLSSGEISVRV